MTQGEDSLLDKMVQAVQRVRDRLLRATAVLEKAAIPYAVIGDNAVAAWVARVDPSAVRNSKDVAILLRRSNLNAATRAFQAAGFVHMRVKVHGPVKYRVMFLESQEAKLRDAVFIVLTGEKMRFDSPINAPDVTESEKFEHFRVLSLEPLVRMLLTSFGAENGMHLRDLLDVGLIDESWTARYPPELASRLQQIIDTPDG